MNLQNRFSQWDCGGDILLVCVYGLSDIVRDNAQSCDYLINSLLSDIEGYVYTTGGFDGLGELTYWFVEAIQVFAIEAEIPFVFRSVIIREGTLHVFVELEMQPQPALN